jgi:hypothetical protein
VPEIGRWISSDPAGFVDGFNLYAYVHNSPLIHVDPDGQLAFLIPIAISFAIWHVAELALPTVVTGLQQYAGGANAAALLSGIVQGYTGNSSSFFSADPSLGLIENSSWALGTIIAYNPLKLSSSAIKNAMCSEMATKATSATFSKAFNWYSKNTARQMTKNSTTTTIEKISKVTNKEMNVGKKIWSSTNKRTSVQNAFKHWKDHRSEFPELCNAKQYVERSRSLFLHSEKTLTKVRNNGEILHYQPISNTFGAFTKDGVPKTMFRPLKGIHYWETTN